MSTLYYWIYSNDPAGDLDESRPSERTVQNIMILKPLWNGILLVLPISTSFIPESLSDPVFELDHFRNLVWSS